MNTRAELDAYFERVPEHVLTVLDQAYFEYIDDPDYPDGIEEYFRRGIACSSCGRSRRSTGSPGLRVGWGVGSANVVTAIAKVRRAFDLNSQAQAAALASLDDSDEVERRRRVNAEERERVVEILERHGFDVRRPGRRELRLRGERGGERPAAVRGAAARGRDRPSARRASERRARCASRSGSPEENAVLDEALGRVRVGAGRE